MFIKKQTFNDARHKGVYYLIYTSDFFITMNYSIQIANCILIYSTEPNIQMMYRITFFYTITTQTKL